MDGDPCGLQSMGSPKSQIWLKRETLVRLVSVYQVIRIYSDIRNELVMFLGPLRIQRILGVLWQRCVEEDLSAQKCLISILSDPGWCFICFNYQIQWVSLLLIMAFFASILCKLWLHGWKPPFPCLVHLIWEEWALRNQSVYNMRRTFSSKSMKHVVHSSKRVIVPSQVTYLAGFYPQLMGVITLLVNKITTE